MISVWTPYVYFLFVEEGRKRETNVCDNWRVTVTVTARSLDDGWCYVFICRPLFLCLDSVSDGWWLIQVDHICSFDIYLLLALSYREVKDEPFYMVFLRVVIEGFFVLIDLCEQSICVYRKKSTNTREKERTKKDDIC